MNGKNENWFGSDGDKLILENFLSDDKTRFVLNESFVSFGVGRRDCVGRQLAMKEIQIMLGYLLINYQLKLYKPIDNIVLRRKNNGATFFPFPPIGVIVTKIQ